MKVTAVIPAGGAGKRMGAASSKQYLKLGGVHMLAHTLKVFQRVPEVDAVVLAVPPPDREFVRTVIVDGYGFSKVSAVVAGGKERQDSVRNGLLALGDETAEDDMVVIHDAVRPFVTGELIRESIDECRKHGSAVLGIPARDTIKRVDVEGFIGTTVDRRGLWLAQTPQTFRRRIIAEAYCKAEEDGYTGTDDASLVERLGIRVRMICGSLENIKITTPADLAYAEYLLRQKAKG